MILRTLGGLSLEGASLHRPKPLLLLAYLAQEGPTERRYLAELFWMDASNARRSLNMALSQLRNGVPGVVGADDVRVWSEIPCDAVLLTHAVEARDWLKAIGLYHGPFLQGFDVRGIGVELEEWIFRTREVLAHGVRRAFLALAEVAAGEARFADAGKWAERARALDDTATPDPDDVARTYQLLLASGATGIHAMREEAEALGLSLVPSQEAARSSLLSIAPASRGAGVGSSLPTSTTSFVGRRRELAHLAGLLGDPAARLLSIVGSAGTGKTRLALRLAADQVRGEAWNDVHFVPLETVPDASQVASAIGASLGLDLPVEQTLDVSVRELRRAIGPRPRLMVLDNVEHLLAAGPLLAELVRACPELRLVVTSRTRLDLDEERILVLEGLPFPGSGTQGMPNGGARAALGHDAVQLFVQRARRVRADFAPDDDDLAAVVRTCALVGGVPLALEMAAAWVRVLTCAEIAHELVRGFELLESQRRDRPERHRSMRVAFEQSWRLLSRDAQRVAKALSVFRGGFAREAASRVAGASLAQLASLVDGSLLSWDGAGRYRLHPLLQRFLEEKARLEPEAAAEVEERHARYYLEGVEARRSSILPRPEQREPFPVHDAGWITAWIDVDLDNVLAAWQWATRRGCHALLENAVEPLGWFFLLRGRPQQGLAWNDIVDSNGTGALLGLRQLLWRGEFLKEQGRLPEAMDSIQQAIRLGEQRGAKSELAHALRLAGFTYLRYDPPDKARVVEAYRRSLELYRELGDAWGEALMLGNLAYEFEDPEETLAMVQEGLALARATGETIAAAMNFGNLAKLLVYCQGEYEAARSAAVEGIACHEAVGFDVHMAYTLLTLGDIHLALGDAAAAESVAARALQMCTSFEGDTEVMVRAGATTLLGHVDRVRGDLDAAAAGYRQALHHLLAERRNEMTVWAAGMSLDGLARIALAEGRPGAARAHAEEALVRLRRYAVHGMLFLPAAIDLACTVRLGEALTLEGEHDQAEMHLLGALTRARGRNRIPALLEALVALAELWRARGETDGVAEIYTLVATHAASPAGLAERAKSAAEGLAPSGLRPRREGVSLADTLSFVLGGERNP